MLKNPVSSPMLHANWGSKEPALGMGSGRAPAQLFQGLRAALLQWNSWAGAALFCYRVRCVPDNFLIPTLRCWALFPYPGAFTFHTFYLGQKYADRPFGLRRKPKVLFAFCTMEHHLSPALMAPLQVLLFPCDSFISVVVVELSSPSRVAVLAQRSVSLCKHSACLGLFCSLSPTETANSQ